MRVCMCSCVCKCFCHFVRMFVCLVLHVRVCLSVFGFFVGMCVFVPLCVCIYYLVCVFLCVFL